MDLFNKIRNAILEGRGEQVDEKVKNPYAVGMAQAMKSTGDTPPLKKSTIIKAHQIAKKVDEEKDSDVPFEGGRPVKDHKDEYGNRISKRAQHLARKAMKHLNKEAVGDITVKSKSSADAYAQHTGQDTKKTSVPKDPKTGKTLYQKVTSEEAEQVDEYLVIPRRDNLVSLKKHSFDTDMEDEMKKTRQTKKSVADAKKKYGVKEGTERGTGTHSVNKKHPKHDELVKAGFEHEAFKHKNGATVHTYWSPENRPFALHKILGNIDEEVEQIDELSPATLGSYIKKASKSAADLKSAGDYHSKKTYGIFGGDQKRKAAQRQGNIDKAVDKLTKEEAEQIDELSPGTLGNYVKRSQGKLLAHGMELQRGTDKVQNTKDAERKINNRFTGVTRATNKLVKKALAKEEAEQVDEVSKATLGRYINKAKDQIDAAAWRSGYRAGKPNDPKSDAIIKAKEKQLSKRHGGISKAVEKLTKEESEVEEGYVSNAQRKAVWAARADGGKGHPDNKKKKMEEEVQDLEELSKKTLGSYGSKALRAGLGGNEKRMKGANLASAKMYPDQYKKSPLKAKVAANEEVEDLGEKRGLWDNIHAKRERIKRGSGERMRKPGSEGAPTDADFKAAQNEEAQIDEISDTTLKSYSRKALDQSKILTGDQKVKRQVGARNAIDRLGNNTLAKEEAQPKEWVVKKGNDVVSTHKSKDEADVKAMKHPLYKVYAKEEVELEEGRGRPRKNPGFTVNPNNKEKLYHDNPEHMAKIEKLRKHGVLPPVKKEPSQHIINRLGQAATNMTGGQHITYDDGKTHRVTNALAAKTLTHYRGLKPADKEAFQAKIAKSHQHHLDALSGK